MLVNPAKIAIIGDLPTPTTLNQLRVTLGHTRYSYKFIRGYTTITTPMEKLLKKNAKFEWNDECQCSLDTLKQKMVIAPISIFPDSTKDIHVHDDASSVALGVILAQPREGAINHPIAFASRNLSTTKRNYTIIEREGLVMVYALQNVHHYLLGGHFKIFMDHSALKYLVNKLVLEGDIFR